MTGWGGAAAILGAGLGWRLRDPLWLAAVLAIPAAAWLRGRRKAPVLVVPFAAAWHRPSLAGFSRWPGALAVAGLALVSMALARPQSLSDARRSRSQGYDIVLAIDLSGSMLSEDYVRDGQRINRLQAIKPVIQAFIERRPADRIGIVVFSGKAYTLAPLTTDHAWLEQQIGRLKIGLIEDGTAIGDAIGIAVTRLEQAGRQVNGKRLGAFIVLLTDGANNMGSLAPMQAADIARTRGIPIYTMGAGKDGIVPFPIFDDQGNQIGTREIVADLDENALQDIAQTTGGAFFRVADSGAIESAFADIDRTQKIQFQARRIVRATELFPWLAVPGLACVLGAGLLLRKEGR